MANYMYVFIIVAKLSTGLGAVSTSKGIPAYLF